jgi:hypothetical protein
MAEDNPEYRFDMFKLYVDTLIKLKGSNLKKTKSEADTRMVLDTVTPQLYMVMIFRVIFRIRTPDRIDHMMRLKIKKEYQKLIEQYIRNQEYRHVSLCSYKHGLTRLLELLDLPPTSNLRSSCDVLSSICDSVETGGSGYHDQLFEVVQKCVDHMLELYERNDAIEEISSDEVTRVTVDENSKYQI